MLTHTNYGRTPFYIKGNATGQLTGSMETVLTGEGKIYKAYYYDPEGRVIKSVESNLSGGHEVAETTYTFTGKPERVVRRHTAAGKSPIEEVYTYSYDHAGRMKQVKHALNGSAAVVLETCGYDKFGRLKEEVKHGTTTGADKRTYTYNIRNWLTGISGSGFTQNLYYHTGHGTPCYNGNISSMTWQAGDEGVLRGYKYSYDGLGRLLKAAYGEGEYFSGNGEGFSEAVGAYDRNGNILNLQRYGQTDASTYGLVDNLSYELDGNRLSRVDDAATASAFGDSFEFKDAVQQENEYAYDANGNLTKDLNRGIAEIQYNFLNLPEQVVFGSGDRISYVYAADGTKLRRVAVIGGITTTTDYCGNVVYENGVPQRLLTDEGYVTLDDGKKCSYG